MMLPVSPPLPPLPSPPCPSPPLQSSLNITDGVDSSPTEYIFSYNGSPIPVSTGSSPECTSSSCQHTFRVSSSQVQQYTVSVSARNVVGVGAPSTPVTVGMWLQVQLWLVVCSYRSSKHHMSYLLAEHLSLKQCLSSDGGMWPAKFCTNLITLRNAKQLREVYHLQHCSDASGLIVYTRISRVQPMLTMQRESLTVRNENSSLKEAKFDGTVNDFQH